MNQVWAEIQNYEIIGDFDDEIILMISTGMSMQHLVRKKLIENKLGKQYC